MPILAGTRPLRAETGFTLVELMIVVVVIGILAVVALPKFGAVAQRAKEAEAEPILKQVVTLQERHRQKHDRYADNFDALEGAADPVRSARYYEFRITGSVSDFVVCARPRNGLDLRAFRIDQSRTVTEIAPAACTGNA